MNNDNIYWLFSSAAQAIAGLIGFLMAGVTLAFSIMDRLVSNDDTLEDVVLALKHKHYSQMATLAGITGLAIVASLFVVQHNPYPGFLRSSGIIFAGWVDLEVIVFAILFVVSATSPKRYAEIAKLELAKLAPAHGSVGSAGAYFHAFVTLEREIRDYLKTKKLYVPSRGGPRMSFSFRQMVDALFQNERIDGSLRDRLMAANKTRNLIFHGHMDQVDDSLLKELQETAAIWQSSRDRAPDSP